MNVVAISTLTPQHRYVMAKLHESMPLTHLIQPVWTPQASSWRQYAKLLSSPFSVVRRRLRSRYDNWRGDRLFRSISHLLGPASTESLPGLKSSVVPIYGFNCEANAALIRELRPDVIVTCGCPILKPEIFGLARLATINVHWGIAPTYRGEHTLFWPLYYNDYENAGVTIHKIDAGIDTGPILAHGFVDITADDDESALLVKAAQVAARLLPGVLAKMEETQTVQGHMATEKGSLYLGRDRSWKHDLAHWRRRRSHERKKQLAAARDEIYIGKPASSF
ncbi:formyl transferase [Blastopirellula sp. JC732]|uniref:phosphoribosylglycinamide formyltransferase 1 n=1 Tax=Blastopirellula sediminis TaxID=2894196 RepID=A0A9X1SF69_9BACT|nr:formyl transferase [Blastopirellula sediminis]MCC9607941.1 formyl transferase [Blastopirellula sediminis]MCC9627266.1 formyl transferase [Blastopirellula sediminis]